MDHGGIYLNQKRVWNMGHRGFITHTHTHTHIHTHTHTHKHTHKHKH